MSSNLTPRYREINMPDRRSYVDILMASDVFRRTNYVRQLGPRIEFTVMNYVIVFGLQLTAR